MALIDLRTNLKSLKYGSDRPGGGSSGQPYIQTNIPPTNLVTLNPDTIGGAGNTNPIYRINSTGGLDFPIRGGAINFQLGNQTFTLSSQIDKSRIKKFFEDAPRGKAFIDKQVGLQLSNPKMETGNTLVGFNQSNPLPGLLENTRVYNLGKNTLAQVGVQGTGVHAIRHGIIPFNPFQKNYYAIVDAQNINNSGATNRLLNLTALKISTGPTEFNDVRNIPDINLINTLGISLNRNLIFQYLGGPGSTYGVGVTTIKRAVDTTRLKSSRTMVYDQLRIQDINNITDGVATTNIQDFRTQLQEYDPEKNWLKQDSLEYKFFIDKEDKMNLMETFSFENKKAPWDDIDNKTNSKDIIKFVFEAISNDNTNSSQAIFFRAFLTAGITDNNSAQLNAFKYMGRGENFYTYQGFDRSISFSFRIAVGSKNELMPLYRKLNALMNQVYPDYSSKQGIMRAPVVRITIGDYLHRVPGFIENVNVTIDNNTTWEINPQDLEYIGLNGNIAQLPQVVDVSISFKPIMDILPNRGQFNSSLIVNSPLKQTNTEQTSIPSPNPDVSENMDAIVSGTDTDANQQAAKKLNINTGQTPQQAKKAKAKTKPIENMPPKLPQTRKNGWMIAGGDESLAVPEKYNKLSLISGDLYFEK